MKEYSHKDILKIVGCTKRQLIHWTEHGLVVPLVDARYRGGKRIYNEVGLLQAKVCRELFQLGFTIEKVRQILLSREKGA